MTQEHVALSEAVEALRSELQKARDKGAKEPLRLIVDELELELQVMVTQGRSGNAGVHWWVIDAEADVRQERATTQTVRMKLRPAMDANDGGQFELSGEIE